MTKMAVLLIAKLRSQTIDRMCPMPQQTREIELMRMTAHQKSGENSLR